MSSALTKASSLKPDIRLAQAVSQFEADLTNEQKSAFWALRSQSLSTAPGPNDVMRLTAEVDRHILAKCSSRCFGPRFTNFLQGVQQFAALGDVVIGGSQNLIACGVWSVVRMSLLSFINLQGYIDKLSSLFMAIGRAAPRYQAIAQLYPRSRKLQSYLIEYFVPVVGLCHYLFKFGQKSAVLQFTSSLSDSHLRTFQAELDKWANLIKEEIYLAEAQESSGSRALAIDFFKSSSRRHDHATRMQVLDSCSKYDHETAWKQIRKAGNASFYAQSVEYQEWKDCSQPRTLIYTGKLGSGKSVLLANIIDNLNLSMGKQQYPVAYFFCKHDVPESLQARTIVGSLVRQLLRTVPDLGALAIHCENTHANCDIEQLLKLFFQGFSLPRKAYLVIDGLDECNSEEKQKLIEAVRKIQEKSELLLCVSFREEPNNDLKSIINQFLATRVVSLPDDNPDIEAFIEADLERCLDQGFLKIGDPKLILEIQDALLKGSQGMFLWVALQIQTLCSMKTDRAIREALENLPKNLSETFARILQKSGSLDPSLQAKTLHLVLAAYRPLTTDELREALSVTPGDATWDPSRILNDVYSALSCCGCLVIVDEEEFTVRVVHHSFKQYVLNGLDGVKQTDFSLREAQRTMADIVVTYLNYGIFGTEVLRGKSTPMMVQCAPSQIVQATMQSSKNRRHLAMKLLRSRQQPAFDMSKVLSDVQANSKSEKDNSFSFYTYAKQYWEDHLDHVSGHDEAILKLSLKVLRSRACKLNKLDRSFCARLEYAAQNGNGDIMLQVLQASGNDLNTRGSHGKTLLDWAAYDGRKSVVELLISTGHVDLNTKDIHGDTPLLTAVSRGHIGVVEVLLKSGKANADDIQESGWTALMIAARDGRKDIVELLLTVGKADASATSYNKDTALTFAVERSDTSMARLLISTGKANVDATGLFGRTALIKAARKGETDMVMLLITVGKANTEARDHVGETVLFYAVQKSDRNMVELLLTTGKADVEAKGLDGKTVLFYAVQNLDRNMVELLLTTGKADVEAKDFYGNTVLFYAVQNLDRNMVELLLTTGKADVEAKGLDGKTVLFYATGEGSMAMIELLLTVGKADVEAKDFHGNTVLMWAVKNRHVNMVKLLLTVGKVDVEMRDNDGDTALIHATREGSMAMIELLVYTGRADHHLQNELGKSAFSIAKEFRRFDLVRLFEGTRV